MLAAMQDEPLSLVTVVVREGASVTAGDLREFLVGKFDKKALRARYADGGLDVTTLR